MFGGIDDTRACLGSILAHAVAYLLSFLLNEGKALLDGRPGAGSAGRPIRLLHAVPRRCKEALQLVPALALIEHARHGNRRQQIRSAVTRDGCRVTLDRHMMYHDPVKP